MNETEQRIATLEKILLALARSDRFAFQKDIQLLDGRNIVLNTSTGTRIGTATGQKLGFYNTTPVDQPATVSDANTQTGSYVQADVQSITTAVNAVIDRLQELGLIA